ncbi:GAF and ANTAR domain-containing protein [Streptomyces sp. NPDC001604]|uniref:GAF and ANTAR domain-containing protein n=1 Tax=Streptomyces sp. NPDC001604 TaxID=3364593 RepID=UPI00368BA292
MAESGTVISDGMAEVLRRLHLDAPGDPAAAWARVLGAEGVALTLLVGAERTPEPLWCHPELSARFEELQFTLGEGPAPDAVRTGSPVLEPDLDRVRPERWPALLSAAEELGVHGVCCFPLGIGAIRVGVLTVLCDGDRRMGEQQYADAGALAAALTGAFLGGDLRRGGDGSPLGIPEPPSVLHRPAVHQATGMISVQLDVSMQEALLRLRAHAYGSERPLGEVAEDVVARRLRFRNDPTDDFTDDFDDDGSGPNSPDGGKG